MGRVAWRARGGPNRNINVLMEFQLSKVSDLKIIVTIPIKKSCIKSFHMNISLLCDKTLTYGKIFLMSCGVNSMHTNSSDSFLEILNEFLQNF